MARGNALFVFLLSFLLVPAALFGQLTTGTLVGNVTTGGNPLPGVTVSVTSPSLQGTRTTVTGEGGGYVLGALPPGKYLVTFELSGMQKAEQSVTVSVSQSSRADASLKVASVSESVTVTAAAPSVMETTAVATNFTSEQINQLPIGRSIDATTDLAPGVTSAGPNNQITMSGATSFDNLFLVDGVADRSCATGSGSSAPAVTAPPTASTSPRSTRGRPTTPPAPDATRRTTGTTPGRPSIRTARRRISSCRRPM